MLVLLLLAVFLPALEGCALSIEEEQAVVPIRAEPPRAPAPYTIQPGDQIDIKFYYHSDLNETVLVRPDGRIALQLIGEVAVAGRSPEDLSKDLVEHYTREGLRRPIVAVMLRKSAVQRVYVGGEVGLPKVIVQEGRLTLSQAIFEAGGMKPTADRAMIVVLRDDGSGTAQVMKIDFDKEVLEAGRDLVLQPLDVVVVPQSGIAKANQAVEQYVSKMLPTWFSIGLSYLLGGRVTNTLDAR